MAILEVTYGYSGGYLLSLEVTKCLWRFKKVSGGSESFLRPPGYSGLLWATLSYSGLLPGYSGLLWATLGYSGGY